MNSLFTIPGRGLRRVGLKHLIAHRGQTALMILGIMLGVALVVAVDMANASARRAFELSTEAITGRATHQITGGTLGVPDSIYRDLRRSGGAYQAAPIISTYVISPQLGSRPMQLLGIDPFVDAPFRSYLDGGQSVPLGQLTVFLTEPGAVLIAEKTALRYGLELGSYFELEIGGVSEKVFVAGLLYPSDELAIRTLDGVILADISTAQELTGREGWLDTIDLILADDGYSQTLQSKLPEGIRVMPVEARQGSVEQMTAAFHLNLSALSMLALVVGLFLIYNTMTFSVVQRRPLFGTLRCLGVTRQEVFSIVVIEAFVIGLIGSILGIGLGILMGQQTVRMVTQTINDLYFTTTVQSVGIPIQSLIKGGFLGIGATLLTAALPAWEAASVPPRAALSRSGLESKTRRMVIWAAIGGSILILLGMLFFRLPGSSLVLGFGGTFMVIFGFAMLAALTMVGLMLLIAPLMGKLMGFLGKMAPRNLVNALSRTSVAVAALMVAVAVTIGVNLMIESFRQTVVIWLETTLQGDVYISAPAFTATTPSDPINPQVVNAVKTWPGVEQANFLRSVTLESPEGLIRVSATTNEHIASERLFLEPIDSKVDVWKAMKLGAVFVSEPLARRLDLLNPGSSLAVYSPNGLVNLPVIGVFYDYASSEGSLLMAMPFYQQIWNEDGITAIDLRLAPGVSPDQVSTSLQDVFNPVQRLLIRPNRALRDVVLEIFDRTFAITAALRILATVVAFIGVLNTLLLMELEKQRELGILRALGLTGRQLWRLVMLETGLMGLTAGILAAPTGYALALILVYVINRRSFGWTLQLALPPEAFLQALLISLTAAILAGIYPAWRMSRMTAADVIRYE